MTWSHRMSLNIKPMKNDFDQFENDRMINDPMNYKWGVFYFNRKDPRVVVPKRHKMTGYTLNFGVTYTYILLILIIASIFLIPRIYK